MTCLLVDSVGSTQNNLWSFLPMTTKNPNLKSECDFFLGGCGKRMVMVFLKNNSYFLKVYTEIFSGYVIAYQFSMAGVTNYHNLGGWKTRTLFPHCPGGQKSKIKVQVGQRLWRRILASSSFWWLSLACGYDPLPWSLCFLLSLSMASLPLPLTYLWWHLGPSWIIQDKLFLKVLNLVTSFFT